MRERGVKRVALAAYLACTGMLGMAAAEPASGPDVKQQTAESAAKSIEIGNWIRQLDDDSYAKREEATRRLVKAGKPAVEPLVEAALGDNLEVTSRVVKILMELYKTDDAATVDAAEVGLEKLQASERGSVLQRVESVFTANSTLRQQRALAAIKRLGGRVRLESDSPEEDEKNPANRAGPGGVRHVILNSEWKGGDQGLVHIKRLKYFPVLYVTTRAPISAEALQELRKSFEPNDLKIEQRGDACLGVQSLLAPGEHCRISSVEKDSAADKAGLKDGDVILKFDGHPVTEFKDMVELIKARAPGDEVEIEILRNEEKLVKKAVLAQWR